MPTASQENIERVPPIGRHLQSLYKKTFVQYKKNETPNKKELTPEARAILAANMTLEYEFYQFVKKRLRLQKRSCNEATRIEVGSKELLKSNTSQVGET